MSSLDVHIGFQRQPEGLEQFLSERGYDREEAQSAEAGTDEEKPIQYSHREHDYPWLFYSPKAGLEGAGDDGDADDEDLDTAYELIWSKAPVPIVSELHIMTKEFDQYEMLNDLAQELVRKYDAVSWEPSLGFFTKSDYEPRR